MRKIIIYSVNNYTIPETLKQSLISRNTEIQYIPVKNSTEELIELYGYDTTLKYKSKNISSRIKFINVLKNIIKKIDNMPMGAIEKTLRNTNHTRKNLLQKCGLPNIAETQHCFADTTHHTCCMLGSKAREYADSSGNPIGSLSVKVNNKVNNTVQTIGKRKSKSKSKKGLVHGVLVLVQKYVVIIQINLVKRMEHILNSLELVKLKMKIKLFRK